MLKKFILASIASMFVAGMAHAQASATTTAAPASGAASCEAKAIGKNGKPLAGAAKASFVKKCQADAMKAAKAGCETKAVGSNGKPLAGAAKSSFMKKCEANAAM
ncbi:MAG: hypothetical protein ACTHNZ_13150 [Trinickia sp.]|uniref:hypothetical protein n=1 Tax=Trinickia sp. TaxID=2571163 RepID=UPI003F7F5562